MKRSDGGEYRIIPGRDWLWTVALALFALTLVLSINAVKLAIGPIPIRLIVLLGAGTAALLADYRALGHAFRDARRALLIIVLAGLLGTVVSVMAATPAKSFLQQLVEIHLQAVIGLVIAYALSLRYGARSVLLCYLGAFGISSLFAIGQALGLDAAWSARAFIGKITGDPPVTQVAYLTRERALGLAFSPVVYATQTCLAIVAFFYLRLTDPNRPRRGIDWVLVGACALFSLLCVITGNRSPLLGIVVFLVIYSLLRAPRMTLAGLPLLLLAAVVAQPVLSYLGDAGVRVARTDSSSENRVTLRKYGAFLIQQRPIGYGLNFDSTQHWQDFAHRARYMDHPLTFRQWALHNYYLMVLAKYGVLLIGLAFLAIPTRRSTVFLWLPFVPYAVHIFFHNDGPLQGDFLIFFLIAAAIWLARRPEGWAGTGERASRPWQRAFARELPERRHGAIEA